VTFITAGAVWKTGSEAGKVLRHPGGSPCVRDPAHNDCQMTGVGLGTGNRLDSLSLLTWSEGPGLHFS
jgi:hypothetical protein